MRRPARIELAVAVCAALLVGHPSNSQQSTAKDGRLPATINLQQVLVDLPSIRVYMDVTGADGKPVPNLTAADVKIAVADRWLPFKSLVPFQSTGEGVAYSVLVDVSQSINSQRFEEMRAAVASWIDRLGDKDRMELLKVGTTAEIAQGFTANHEDLLRVLKSLKRDAARTALYAALIRAMREQSSEDLPARRVIVVLTDGKDDDDLTGQTQLNLLSDIDQIRVPIFAIGVTAVPPKPTADKFLKSLAEIALRSNGLYRPLEASSAASLYEEMRQAILRVYVGSLWCDSCPHDGRSYGLKVNVRGRDSSLVQIVLLPPTKVSPWYRTTPALVGVALIVVILAGLAIWFILRRHKRPPDPVVAVIPPKQPQRRGQEIVFAVLGKQTRYEAELVDRVVLGTNAQCDVCLPGDNSILDRHCEISQRDGFLFIRDLGNPGATAVNGVTIRQPHRIENHDIVRVGRTELRILVGATQ
jgi:hypothetical protein